jgi:serine/threonine protein kinase
LGPYEILSPLGAGGMGEVYRARDSRLGREVAIKIIPEAFARDPDRLERFEREARAASSLSDPHIVVVHDVGEDNGVRYFASELVEGPDLRAIMDRGPMPARRILDLGAQIAEGLAAAHEKGILHRDLKPENVLLSKERLAKIADFGLAKITDGSRAEASQTPTAAANSTGTGIVMGTVSYMSPEQARGAPVDHRSDQFALGSILYEMAAGRKAFARPTAAEVMTAILREEPEPLSTAAPVSPAPLRWIVERLLSKEPHDRYDSTRDLARELASVRDHLSTSSISGVAEPVSGRPARSLGPVPYFAAAIAGAILAAAGFLALKRPSAGEPVKIRYLTYSGHDREPAVSPDGRTVAFSSDRDGRTRIWIKQLEGGGEAPLTSGSADMLPRFSPNGASILFIRTDGSRSALYRSSVVGGEEHKLVDGAEEADWSPDGSHIVIVRRGAESFSTAFSVSDASGSGEHALARVPGRQFYHPRWSPDGRRIVAVESASGGAPKSLAVVDAGTGKLREIRLPGYPGLVSAAAWTADGHEVVYSRAESVAAVVVGSASEIVAHNVDTGQIRPLAWSQESNEIVEILSDGNLVFDTHAVRENLREVALAGSTSSPASGRWLTEGEATDRQPAYSPDGKWIVFSSSRGGNLDLWKVSTETGEMRQLTDDAAQDWDPAFSRDGRRLIWSSNRTGAFEIWTADADGSAAHAVTHDRLDSENPTETADGRWIVFMQGAGPKFGIWRIRPDGTGGQFLFGDATIPEVSPDGERALSILSPSISEMAVTTIRTSDGKPDGFRIELPQGGLSLSRIVIGRGRWMPDGKSVLVVNRDAKGKYGIQAYPFAVGVAPGSGSWVVPGFDSSFAIETFGISPDGKKVVVAGVAISNSLMTAAHVPGVRRPAAGR